MMIRNRKLLRAIALFFLIDFIQALVAPSIAHALTAGPTAPEATTFEPVDTTDMVNLQSGDLTYGIPLLEVPGPEGGYPLSLSYHGGIAPGLEASWVGLGWTLNPGAITRNVNGYPDDIQATTRTVRDYWRGGERHSYSVGVSVGIDGFGSVSAGLVFANDTYKGFGMGGNVGVGIGLADIGDNGSMGISGSVGVGPYGGTYASAGVFGGLSMAGESATQGLSLGGSLGVSTNFESTSVNGGVSVSLDSYENKPVKGQPNTTEHVKTGSQSLMGVSMSSSKSGLAVSTRMAGFSASQKNSKAGKITTQSWGFNAPIPIAPGVSINLGYNYMRYFSDETDNVTGVGSLYPSSMPKNADEHSFDSYALLDPTLEGGIVDNSNADELNGGSFPAFDQYNVHAQGLSGSMQPYTLQHQPIFRQNARDESGDSPKDLIIYETMPTTNHVTKLGFRFMNDFSNRNTASFGTFIKDDNYKLNVLASANAAPTAGYNRNTNRLAGSKHIEHFTVAEINSDIAHTKGFVDYQPKSVARPTNLFNTNIANQVGGYTITNETGMNYHFALPAYAYGEYQRFQNIEDPSDKFTELKNPNAYAYTWFLTAMTGPDYVDRNNNGMADDGDWGYWVTFDYGKWSDKYTWRTPEVGTNKDLDSGFENYSYGHKQVYYLDAIKTRSHTALFVKDIREDGKSYTNDNNGYQFRHGGCIRSERGEEAFAPIRPIASLQLKNILLLSNKQLQGVNLNNLKALAANPTYEVDCAGIYDGNYTLLNTASTLDVRDIAASNINFTELSIRGIDLVTSYDLSPKTINSSNIEYYSPQSSFPLSGKLTLDAIKFLGKKGADLMPPMSFEYDLSDPKTGGGAIYKNTVEENGVQKDYYSLYAPYLQMEEGDIFRFNGGGKAFYFLLKGYDTSISRYRLCKLGNEEFTQSSYSGTLTQTKNPPYNSDAHDMWGMYKSDYDESTRNDNLKRMTSNISAKNVDVWSLRRINTQLGAHIDIEYESDDYSHAPMYKNQMLQLEAITNISGNTMNLSFHGVSNLDEVYSEGDEVSGVLGYSSGLRCDRGPFLPKGFAGSFTGKVINAAPNEIQVESEELKELITNKSGIVTQAGQCTMVRTWYAGNVSAPIKNKTGGGLRVAKIKIIDDPQGLVGITNYNYQRIQTELSSGVTVYEPAGMNPYVFKESYYSLRDDLKAELENEYQKLLYNAFSELLALSRELPSPQVMYEYVTVSESVSKNGAEPIDTPLKQTFHFQVFEEDMVQVERAKSTKVVTKAWVDLNPAIIDQQMVTIKDYTSRLGTLLNQSTYDDKGRLISQTINEYSPNTGNNQGVIQQTFSELKTVYAEDRTSKYVGALSKREEHPNVLKKTITKDFNTGKTAFSQNIAFDFYSGEVLEAVHKDMYDNYYRSKAIPAYEKYGAMGLKVHNTNNKNMLTQTAATYLYKVDENNYGRNDQVLNASVTTWKGDWDYRGLQNGIFQTVATSGTGDATSNIPLVWRMHETYAWESDQLNADGTIANFTDFNWTAGANQANNWKKMSEVTRYNEYSHALEAKDRVGQYAATKMDAPKEKVIATSALAKYTEFTFSGFENTLDGELRTGNGAVYSTDKAHTGSQSLKMPNQGRCYYKASAGELTGNRDYIVSYWSNSSDASKVKLFTQTDGGSWVAVNSYDANRKITLEDGNEWYLHRAVVSVHSYTSAFSMICYNANTQNAYIDDFRLHPIETGSMAYVYDQNTRELTHILNANNLFTRYEYDDYGRLKATYQESLKHGVKKVSGHAYNYGNN